MENPKYANEKIMHTFFLAFSIVLIITAGLVDPKGDQWLGLGRIMTSPQILTTDACAVGGLGGALLNAGLLGLVVLGLQKLSGTKANGAAMGAFFLTVGFAFFGKNLLNIWPVIFGVWLYSRLKKEDFGKYVNMAFFACSLAPFISEALFNRYLDYSTGLGLLVAILIGIVIGLLFPPLTAHTVSMHKGHNLFNAGLSAGLLAFLLFTTYKTVVLRPMGLEEQYTLNAILSGGYPLFFPIFLATIFVAAIAAGFLLDGKSWNNYKNLLNRSGHNTDFTVMDGAATVLINFGVLGLVCLAYFLLIKAPFTGPTVGAFLCILCWAGTGSHPRNVVPIMAGYALVSLLAAWNLGTQAVVVAFCFGTGLAPLGGRWGWWWGIVAGALQSCVAGYTPAIYGGFNIYNGGFAAGLVALILIPFLETFFQELPTSKIASTQNISHKL